MQIVRKLAVTAVAALLSVGLAGITTPASAADSSWGCGGSCKTGPTRP